MSALLIPACTLVLYALWVVSPWGMAVEQRLGLETLFRWRGERKPPDNIVVIAITSDAAQKLRLPSKLHQWSRSVHASAVTTLQRSGARLIVFDIFFEQARDVTGDNAFAEALGKSGNVLLFARAERQRIDLDRKHYADQESITPPLPLFADAALAVAPLILPKIPARVDRFFLHHPALPEQLTLPALALRQLYPDRQMPAGASLLYNFYGPPHTITTIDLSRLLMQPEKVQKLLRNAVVFIGYSASYQNDQRDGFYTAFTADNGLDISGVELAATAYGNLMESSWLKEAPKTFNAIWIMAFGALLFLLSRIVTPAVSVLLLAITACIASMVIYYAFVSMNFWLPWFNGVLLQTPLVGSISIWQRGRELFQQKTLLQQAFGKYLPAEEVRRLVIQGEFAGSQTHHHSVCLVTDAQGYTRLSERITPVELSQLMQDYYSAVIGAIRAGNGLISDVAGDGIIALWPHLAPQQVWSTLQPVITAIQQSVAIFNISHPQHVLPTRVGIHCGEIVLGHFGALDHYEFRAMGDIVNTTSRLEGVNKQIGTQVLISADCLNEAQPELIQQLRYLGCFKFVGKDEPMRLYTPVTSEPQSLLSAFSAALAKFERGEWKHAAGRFKALALRFPDDGPSRFYMDFLLLPRTHRHERCELEKGIVNLQQK